MKMWWDVCNLSILMYLPFTRHGVIYVFMCKIWTIHDISSFLLINLEDVFSSMSC
jgi:hypothetical protein